MSGKFGYPTYRPWTPANAEHNVTLMPERMDQPLRWTKPRMIFVNSMSDLFHELVPIDYIASIFEIMHKSPRHTFQVLTKRPERMRDVVTELLSPGGVGQEFNPSPNVWLGTSIENRHYVGRADALRDTPAAVRFISAEPLLGPLVTDDGHRRYEIWPDGKTNADFPQLDLTNIDWLIVGGESGPDYRSMRKEWAKDLLWAARESGTAFFFKQWGGPTPKSRGRLLDGQTYDEMPVPTRGE